MSNIKFVQPFWNFAQNFKNKQVVEIWSLYLIKQKIGTTIRFPEGLENTPFKIQP